VFVKAVQLHISVFYTSLYHGDMNIHIEISSLPPLMLNRNGPLSPYPLALY